MSKPDAYQITEALIDHLDNEILYLRGDTYRILVERSPGEDTSLHIELVPFQNLEDPATEITAALTFHTPDPFPKDTP